MPQKYYNVKEAAKVLGITDADVKQLLDARELHGYRDGADWKFKSEDIERMATERKSAAHDADREDGDVLLSEVALGHSDPGMSGTVIGGDKPGGSSADSDIRLAQSDVGLGGSDIKLAASDIGLAASDVGLAASDINLAESDIKLESSDVDLAGPQKPARKDEVAKKVSQFEALDMTLDQDLSLEDSNVAATPAKPAGKPAAPAGGDSAVDLSGKKLEDDDLVLGGSGTGSDITIGGDSGISLVDPADSGLSLEAPMNLSPGGDESLELGEDDLLGFAPESSGLKSEDDFQLTPMDEGADADDSESGSQVIALDTDAEGDEAATMIASSSGSSVAAMLDEDLGGESPLLAGAPLLAAGAGELALAGQPEALAGGVYMSAALPEAPYSIWNIISLVLCSLLLILVGMMMYDLLRNMWSWERSSSVNSWLMDTILKWFEK